MLNYQEDNHNYSYKPLQTEFISNSNSNNLNYSNSIKFIEPDNNFQSPFSRNTSIFNNENAKNLNEKYEETLYSERVSNSKINLSDSDILLKKLNDIKSSNKKKENQDFITPKKEEVKDNIQYIPDVFNHSSNNSKNINISNLNVKISNNNIQQNLIHNLNNENKAKEIDLKKEIEKNLKDYFEKKLTDKNQKTTEKIKRCHSAQEKNNENNNNQNILQTEILGNKNNSFSKNKKLPISNKKIKIKYSSIFSSLPPPSKYKQIYTERLSTEKRNLSKIPKYKNKSIKKNLSTKSIIKKNLGLDNLKYSNSTIELINDNKKNSNVTIKTEFNLTHNFKNKIPKSTKKINNTITHYKNNDFYQRHKVDSKKLKKNKNNNNLKPRSSSVNSERNKILNLTNSTKYSNKDLSNRTRTNSKKKSNRLLNEEEIKQEQRIKNYKLYHDYLTTHCDNKYKKFTQQIQEMRKEKPIVQVYKNNIKHITVAPISKITLKIFENNLKMKKDRVFKNNLYELSNNFTFKPKNYKEKV